MFTNNVLNTQDMAWGVKTMKFQSGCKVKIGNVVLEAMQSQIIRDYISATQEHNESCSPEGKIRIFSSRTYRRWLKVDINGKESQYVWFMNVKDQ